MFVALLLSGALLADVTPAADPAAAAKPAAETAKPAAEAAKPAAKPEKRKLICHSEATIGSLFPTKVCVSAEEEKDRQMQDRQALERMQQTTITPR